MKKAIVLIVALVIVFAIGLFLFVASQRGTTTVPDETNSSTFPTEKGPLIFPPGTTASPNNTEGSSLIENNGADISNSGAANFPDISNTATNTTLANNVRTIKRISHGPVAGATTVGTVRGVNLFVRYLEKGTGYIYDYRPIGGGEERISSKTIPRVLEAYFGNKGQTALLRYLDGEGVGVKNYLVRIDLSTSSGGRIRGSFIQDDLADVAVAPPGEEHVECPVYLPAGKTLSKGASNDPVLVRKVQNFLITIEHSTTTIETGLYDDATANAVTLFQEKYREDILVPAGLTKGTGSVGAGTRAKMNSIYCEHSGGQVAGTRLFTFSRGGGNAGVMGDFDHTTGNTQFLSPIEEWQVEWPERNTLVLTTAPANTAPGYAYTLSAKGVNSPLGLKNLVPLLGDIKGLTLLASPTLEWLIYTSATSRSLLTYVQNKNGTHTFPLITLPTEKCAWSRIQKYIVYCAAPSGGIGGGEPDNWYQGRTVFSDNIYSVNLETDTVTLLYAAASPDTIDIKRMFVAEDDSHLFFVNKIDGYLWQLSLGVASGD